MNEFQKDRLYFGADLYPLITARPYVASRVTKLQQANLPPFRCEADLAAWLGISIGRLRWFTFDRLDDTMWHYVRYSIPKRAGGYRTILAPKHELKQIQRTILHGLLYTVQPFMTSTAAHGFIPMRSIISNARQHVGKQVILHMDIKDFFPSIQFPKIFSLFIELGYSSSVAATLTLLCTERDRSMIVKDGVPHFRATGPRHLVQGAPTSPSLANLTTYDLDVSLESLANSYELTYTRYADDLIFSGSSSRIPGAVLSAVQSTVNKHGFEINHAKTSFAHKSSRQMVTGVVVNSETTTPRTLRRKLRAILHNAGRSSITDQNRDAHPNFEAYLQGIIAFTESVNPRQSLPLREAFHQAQLATYSPSIHEILSAPRSPQVWERPAHKTIPTLQSESSSDTSPYHPKEGDRVIHPRYGRGVVTRYRTSRDESFVTVRFSYSKAGEREFNTHLAHFQRDPRG